jgi:very-short-patch-repair endonuclease
MHDNPNMKSLARNLRKTQTIAEDLLWRILRGRQFAAHKFRRQRVLGPYIADFVCLKQRLIIELDGNQHLANVEYDKIRTAYLESMGFHVLRFWNNQVLDELNLVLSTIRLTLTRRFAPPSPTTGEGSLPNNIHLF